MTARYLLYVGLFVIATVAPESAIANDATSRIYVTAYPCAPNDHGGVVTPGQPTVSLYDQAFYGESNRPVSEEPGVTVTSATGGTVTFYFDIAPGNYDAFIKFSTVNKRVMCGRNGPLVVLPGKDRHLFVAAMTGLTDWHAPGAVAGTLPMPGVDVSVLVYDHPMLCGDNVRSYDPRTFKPTVTPHVGSAVIDDGAYYQNIHAYGKQDRTVAIEFRGALFTHGTVLLTVTPDTKQKHPPFIQKDVTTDILRAATAKPFEDKLVCIPGF